MLYTFTLYLLIILLYSIHPNSEKKFLGWVFVLVGFYLGIRYNYMPDYVQYHRVFDMFNSVEHYVYDPERDHAEYGWFILNRFFAPVGFFTFVFVCSCIFAYANYKFFDLYKIKCKYLLVAVFGMVTCANFSILSSAQRQFVATTVFLLAYRYCVYGQISKVRDLLSHRLILYYFLIGLASTFHSSAIILEIIPFLYFVPYKKKLVLVSLGIFFLAVLFAGMKFLPNIMNSVIQQSDSYEYLMDVTATNGQTFLGVSMMILRVFMLLFILSKYELPREHAIVLVIAYISAIFTATAFSLVQIDRLSFYLITFDYLSYAIVLKYLSSSYRHVYSGIIWLWYLWGILKLFQPIIYDWQEYKTIFSVL